MQLVPTRKSIFFLIFLAFGVFSSGVTTTNSGPISLIRNAFNNSCQCNRNYDVVHLNDAVQPENDEQNAVGQNAGNQNAGHQDDGHQNSDHRDAGQPKKSEEQNEESIRVPYIYIKSGSFPVQQNHIGNENTVHFNHSYSAPNERQNFAEEQRLREEKNRIQAEKEKKEAEDRLREHEKKKQKEEKTENKLIGDDAKQFYDNTDTVRFNRQMQNTNYDYENDKIYKQNDKVTNEPRDCNTDGFLDEFYVNIKTHYKRIEIAHNLFKELYASNNEERKKLLNALQKCDDNVLDRTIEKLKKSKQYRLEERKDEIRELNVKTYDREPQPYFKSYSDTTRYNDWEDLMILAEMLGIGAYEVLKIFRDCSFDTEKTRQKLLDLFRNRKM